MSERTVRRIVVLEVLQNHNPGDVPPEWHEALSLPAPERWSELLDANAAHAKVLVERTIASGATP